MMAANQAIQLTTSVVDWKMFGAWLDTEGSISSIIAKTKVGKRAGHKRDHELAIYQADRHSLEILRDFLTQAGVTDSRMHQDLRTGVWSLKLTRIADIELVIRKVEPYLLTERKRQQVERFKRFRSDKFKRISEVVS